AGASARDAGGRAAGGPGRRRAGDGARARGAERPRDPRPGRRPPGGERLRPLRPAGAGRRLRRRGEHRAQRSSCRLGLRARAPRGRRRAAGPPRRLRARPDGGAVHVDLQPRRLPEAGRAMTDDRTRRWFFVHMHKTAGTTLYYRLRDAFPGGAVYPTRDEQRAWKASLDVEVLLRQFVARQHELRIVTGHFPLCTTELLGVPFSTITVLREPVERTLSA